MCGITGQINFNKTPVPIQDMNNENSPVPIDKNNFTLIDRHNIA